MKNKVLSFAASLALLAVAGHFYAKPLLAAVAALVKNVDERGRNPYAQQVTCYIVNSNQCSAIFPAVPANMRLVVEHVNISVDTPTPLVGVDLGMGGMILYPLMTLQGQDPAGNSVYIANQPLLMYAEAGTTPAVTINTRTGGFEFISSSITLTGYLVNLAQ